MQTEYWEAYSFSSELILKKNNWPEPMQQFLIVMWICGIFTMVTVLQGIYGLVWIARETYKAREDQ